MKRIQVCATVLGLLMFAVAARAADQETITVAAVQNGTPQSGVDVLVLYLKPVAQYTTASDGSAQIRVDKTDTGNGTANVSERHCRNKTIVYIAFVGATPPEEKREDCGAVVFVATLSITGDGVLRVEVAPGIEKADFTPAPAAAVGAGPGEGHPPVTFEASFSGGLTHASNLSNAPAIEGDVTVYFGPFGGGGGVFHTGNATGQQATGATPGGSLPPFFTTTAHVNAAEFFASVRPLDVKGLKIALMGGGMAFTARETSTGTVVFTTPTGGTTTEVITTNTEKGGVAPYFAGRLEVPVTKWFAAQVTVKRIYLRSDHSLNQGITVVTFGGSVSPGFSRPVLSLFK